MDIIQVSKARKEILKEPTHVLKGVISSSIPNVLSVPFRLHFEVPDAEVVEDEIKKEEGEEEDEEEEGEKEDEENEEKEDRKSEKAAAPAPQSPPTTRLCRLVQRRQE
jgi:hypothetical protein